MYLSRYCRQGAAAGCDENYDLSVLFPAVGLQFPDVGTTQMQITTSGHKVMNTVRGKESKWVVTTFS